MPRFNVNTQGEYHGWWFAMEDPGKRVLWFTLHPMVKGQYTTTLEKRFGEIETITSSPNGWIYLTCVKDPGQRDEKVFLSKELFLAPIPPVLLKKPNALLC